MGCSELMAAYLNNVNPTPKKQFVKFYIYLVHSWQGCKRNQRVTSFGEFFKNGGFYFEVLGVYSG